MLSGRYLGFLEKYKEQILGHSRSSVGVLHVHSLQLIVGTGVRPDLHPVPLIYLASAKVRFGARRETPFNHKATLYTSPALYTAGLSCFTHLAKATRKSGSDTA